MSAADTWGIDGTSFLELYGVLAVLTAIVICDAQRSERQGLESRPAGAELPLAVALFGTGVLWPAAPEIATAYVIPRDGGAGSSGGSGGGGGGGCGGGCGG